MSMIKLSSGVEISEQTVLSALQSAGIEVKPKHIFESGDVAYYGGRESKDDWRFMVRINGKLYSVNLGGAEAALFNHNLNHSQKYFERNNYKFAGKLRDLIEI